MSKSETSLHIHGSQFKKSLIVIPGKIVMPQVCVCVSTVKQGGKIVRFMGKHRAVFVDGIFPLLQLYVYSSLTQMQVRWIRIWGYLPVNHRQWVPPPAGCLSADRQRQRQQHCNNNKYSTHVRLWLYSLQSMHRHHSCHIRPRHQPVFPECAHWRRAMRRRHGAPTRPPL